MTPEEMAQLLDELEQRLGPKAEYLLRLATQYKVTDAIAGIIFALVMLGLSAVAVRWVWRHQFRDQGDREIAVVIAVAVGGLFSLIAMIMLFIDVVTLLNPEYAAIRDLVRR